MTKKINFKLSEESLDGFTQVLKKEKRFRIFPIGTFHLRTRKAMRAHNVNTGEWEDRPKMNFIKFKASKWLREIIK